MSNVESALYYLWEDGKIVGMHFYAPTASSPQPTETEIELVRIFNEYKQLEAENQRLQMIINAIEEWGVVDMNNDLLAFIRETKECKSKEEIESKLKGG